MGCSRLERCVVLVGLAGVWVGCSSESNAPAPPPQAAAGAAQAMAASPSDAGGVSNNETLPPTVLAVRSLAVGARFACALAGQGDDERIFCWGTPLKTQAPAGASAFTKLYAGVAHVCGLAADGTAQCWGDCGAGRCDVPGGEKLSMLAPGGSHTCALRTDGSAVCWGDDVNGQASPDANAKFKQLAAGTRTTCGVTIDDILTCWGFDLTNPPTGQVLTVSMLLESVCALRPDGAPTCGGRNVRGEASPPADEHFSAISTGGGVSCALRADGSVRCWGQSTFGNLDPPAEAFSAIGSGGEFSCGVRKSDQRVLCWGNPADGQTMVPQAIAAPLK